jgi:hypothetical protein
MKDDLSFKIFVIIAFKACYIYLKGIEKRVFFYDLCSCQNFTSGLTRVDKKLNKKNS